MRVYKFGGASVKDAASIRNVKSVLEQTGYENLLIVISAMGKITNALEKVVHNYFHNKADVNDAVEEVLQFHHAILSDLFPEKSIQFMKKWPIFSKKCGVF